MAITLADIRRRNGVYGQTGAQPGPGSQWHYGPDGKPVLNQLGDRTDANTGAAVQLQYEAMMRRALMGGPVDQAMLTKLYGMLNQTHPGAYQPPFDAQGNLNRGAYNLDRNHLLHFSHAQSPAPPGPPGPPPPGPPGPPGPPPPGPPGPPGPPPSGDPNSPDWYAKYISNPNIEKMQQLQQVINNAKFGQGGFVGSGPDQKYMAISDLDPASFSGFNSLPGGGYGDMLSQLYQQAKPGWHGLTPQLGAGSYGGGNQGAAFDKYYNEASGGPPPPGGPTPQPIGSTVPVQNQKPGFNGWGGYDWSSMFPNGGVQTMPLDMGRLGGYGASGFTPDPYRGGDWAASLHGGGFMGYGPSGFTFDPYRGGGGDWAPRDWGPGGPPVADPRFPIQPYGGGGDWATREPYGALASLYGGGGLQPRDMSGYQPPPAFDYRPPSTPLPPWAGSGGQEYTGPVYEKRTGVGSEGTDASGNVLYYSRSVGNHRGDLMSGGSPSGQTGGYGPEAMPQFGQQPAAAAPGGHGAFANIRNTLSPDQWGTFKGAMGGPLGMQQARQNIRNAGGVNNPGGLFASVRQSMSSPDQWAAFKAAMGGPSQMQAMRRQYRGNTAPQTGGAAAPTGGPAQLPVNNV